MAQDTFIKKIIDNFKEEINQAKGDDLERALRLFAKEVERETRHNAAELAAKLSTDIMNL
jgi:hypothetical protein